MPRRSRSSTASITRRSCATRSTGWRATHEIAAVLFAGGEEKVSERRARRPGRALRLRGDAAGRRRARRRCASWRGGAAPRPSSTCPGDPVLTRTERFALAAVALDLGLEYRAPGMRLTPPPAERIDTDVPVAGGDRHRQAHRQDRARHAISRRCCATRAREPVVVSMGRGGPAAAELVRAGRAARRRRTCSRSRAAAGTPRPTTSRTRCSPASPRSAAGAAARGRRARRSSRTSSRACGSRCARTRRRGARGKRRRAAAGGGGPHRLRHQRRARRAGRPVVPRARCGCCARSCWSCSARPTLEPARARRAGRPAGGMDRRAMRSRCASCEPEPAEAMPAGARVACFTTAPPGRRGAAARGACPPGRGAAQAGPANLARRATLERDVEAGAGATGCDVFLTELKAAAIEIVADARACRPGRGSCSCATARWRVAGEPLDDRLAARSRDARRCRRDEPGARRTPRGPSCAATTGCPTRRG